VSATTDRLNAAQRVPGEDCIHEEMDYTDRPRITNRDTVQTWIPGSPVLLGTEWCWSHGEWERKEEKT
jgi:hypothetical protein